MTDDILFWFTLALWVFWLLRYWGGGRRIVADVQRSSQSHASRLDTLLLVVITLLTAVLFGTGVLLTMGVGREFLLLQSVPATLLGTGLTLGGMLGTFYCRAYLGRFWTAEVALQPDHQVVDQGPYGLVRHPIYTAAVVMYAGTALVFPTVWTVASVVIVILAYAFKTADEDRYLAQTLVGYADYQQRVPYRLLPWLW